jgi:hypothetical protein
VGFVIGGVILSVAGGLALVRSTGLSDAGRRRQILSSGSLVLVGIVLIVYGLS